MLRIRGIFDSSALARPACAPCWMLSSTCCARAASGACCRASTRPGARSTTASGHGGVRGFDGHKLVKGRKRHILVDTLGLIITSRVEPAGVSDQRAGARLLGGLRPLFPAIRTVMADAGQQSRKFACALKRHEGWSGHHQARPARVQDYRADLDHRAQPAWLGRNRHFSKDYEYQLQISETLIDVASFRFMLNRLAPV
jgi:putative transposase